MNSKKGFEYLNKLKQTDTSQQLQQFLNKKQVFTQTTYKQRLLKYLEQIMPVLYHQQASLQYQLNIEEVILKKKPTLKQFFELLPEEQQLSIELSEMYTKTYDNSAIKLLQECSENPKQLINVNRAFNAKEYHLLENMLDQLQLESKQLLNFISSVQQQIPITTSTFRYFDKYDLKPLNVENEQTNIQLQISNICLLQENSQNEKTTDIYAEAFKINKQILDQQVNQLKDKIRNNIQIKLFIENIKLHILQIDQLVDNPLEDEEFDQLNIMESDQLQQKLDKTQNNLNTTAKHFTNTNTTQSTIVQQNHQPQITEQQKQMIKMQTQKQIKNEIEKASIKFQTQVSMAENNAQQVLRKKIVQNQDDKLLQKQIIQKQKLEELEQQRLNRVKAAERDADKVKPVVKDDPERLFRDTQTISSRKAQVQLRKDHIEQLTRGNYDMQINGEQLIGIQNIGFNKALSFDVMSKLAERGLLGTAAARDAIQIVLQSEQGQRFQQWAMRDDVRRLW